MVRVPRERMVGHGIASSLVHEVGHQAAALLGLVESLRPVLSGTRAPAPGASARLAAAGSAGSRRSSPTSGRSRKVGIASTLGLIGVVSLPRLVRLPAEPRRPASDSLDPREAVLRDRRRALSASAMARLAHAVGVALSARRARPARGQLFAVARGDDARLRGAAGRPSPARAARPVAAATSCRWPSGSPTGSRRYWHAGVATPRRMPRGAAVARLRRDRPGALARRPDARGGERHCSASLLTYWALRSTLDAARARADLPTANDQSRPRAPRADCIMRRTGHGIA